MCMRWDCKIKAKALRATKRTREIGQQDPRRVTHSIKAGLALTMVSLFYYFTYDNYKASGMWAVMTVVVLFEFTAGATLYKTINRCFATLLAGATGVGASYYASHCDEAKPLLLGMLVFLLTSWFTFIRFFPEVKRRYDYGALIFILTFNLVTVSDLRVDEIYEIAHQRLTTVLAGAAICLVISILIRPVWAGEELQNMVTSNMEKLADFLEGFGAEYFKVAGNRASGVGTKDGDSFLKAYKKVLDSKSIEESMANYAEWEPAHGNFRFCHPWKQFLNVGQIIRKCAYHIDALSNCLNSESQAPLDFLKKIEEPCMEIGSECSKALKELASGIKTMTHPSSALPHIANSMTTASELESILKATSGEISNLLKIKPTIMVASTLIDVAKCVEKIAESTNELSNKAHFKSVDMEMPSLSGTNSVKPIENGDHGGDGNGGHVIIVVHDASMHFSENENHQASKADSPAVPAA
ncbi:hypothetical protein NMG60_11001551 [Bertholletia excelsa]